MRLLKPQNAMRFSHGAMATAFEIALIHEDARYAEQCAHEAFRELDRVEQNLSRFIENSDVSRINRARVDQPVRMGLDAFESLEHCARLSSDTKGAFDVTIGPLLEYWGRHTSPDEELSRIHKTTGMHLVHLDRAQHTVTLRSEGMSIDLGGYGKGYALDRMADVLKEWEIGCAVIHGGHSSILALGGPPGEEGWEATLRHPSNDGRGIEHVWLQHQAISSSGIRRGRHIIDPRTAYPVTETQAAWAMTSTAAEGDALSTAFMIMSPEEILQYCEDHRDRKAIVIRSESRGAGSVLRFG